MQPSIVQASISINSTPYPLNKIYYNNRKSDMKTEAFLHKSATILPLPSHIEAFILIARYEAYFLQETFSNSLLHTTNHHATLKSSI